MLLHVSFGRESKVVTLDSANTPLVELKRAVFDAFGVLQPRQKLLHKGKDLAKLEGDRSAGAAGLKPGSKVLLLETRPVGAATDLDLSVAALPQAASTASRTGPVNATTIRQDRAVLDAGQQLLSEVPPGELELLVSELGVVPAAVRSEPPPPTPGTKISGAEGLTSLLASFSELRTALPPMQPMPPMPLLRTTGPTAVAAPEETPGERAAQDESSSGAGERVCCSFGASEAERGESEGNGRVGGQGAGGPEAVGLLQLPDHLVEHILALLPLDERLRCEAVCTEWRSRVQEAKGLWRHVDLSTVAARKRRNFTDAALERLLRHGAGRAPPPHYGFGDACAGSGEEGRPAPTVQHLHLQGCTRLTAAALIQLTQCTALRALYLNGSCEVSVADCTALAALRLQCCHVDLLVEPHQLPDALRLCPLDIPTLAAAPAAQRNDGDDGDGSSEAAAAAAIVVRTLRMVEGRVRPGHVRTLADAVEGNCRLCALSLAGNPHVLETDGGAGAFAVCRLFEALERNGRLTRLDLSDCLLGHAGADTTAAITAQLAQALAVNTSLRELELGGNHLGWRACRELFEVMVGTTTLRCVGLSHNAMTVRNLSGFVQVLQHNTTLEVLDVSNNKLLADLHPTAPMNRDLHRLQCALAANRTLRKLGLRGMGLGCATNTNAVPPAHHSHRGEGASAVMRALATALVTNATLMELDVGDDASFVLADAHELAAALASPTVALRTLRTRCALPLGALRTDALDVLSLHHQGLMAEDMVLLAAGLRRATPLPRVCLLQYNRVCWATAAASTMDEFSTHGVEALVAALLSHHTSRPSQPGVRNLDLSGNFLSAVGLAAISPLTACVDTLRLEDCGLVSASRKSWHPNAMMTQVDVAGLHVLGAHLSGAAAVHTLSLAGNRLGSAGLQALATHMASAVSLTSLDVGKNFVQSSSITTSAPVDDTGTAALAMAIGRAHTLQHISLAHTCIQGNGGLALGAALALHSALTSIDLEGCDIGEDAAMQLGGALAAGVPMVMHLNLASNKLGAAGSAAVACGLAVRPRASLQRLCLRKNGAGADAAAGIARALQGAAGAALRHLDMSANALGSEGCMSLAAGMRSSSSLHTVDLSLNQLGATAGRALAAVLASADCLTLSVLRLWRNPLTDDGVVALMDALSDSTAPLRMLDLRECRVSSRGAASVAHVLNDRSVARALRVLDLRGNTLNDGAVRDSLLALVTRDVHVTLK